MKKDDMDAIDFHAFAKLRGKKCQRPASWTMLVSLLLFLAGLLLLVSHNGWAGRGF